VTSDLLRESELPVRDGVIQRFEIAMDVARQLTVRYAELVREYLNDHKRIRNVELRELLALGDSPSAQVEASRYLKKWSQDDGF